MRIIATVASLICFIAVWWWAWDRRNKGRFDEAANLPFEEDRKPDA